MSQHLRRQAELQAATIASAERRKSKGFVRGTIIHTPGGPVPVEFLKAGYMVLSRAPDPGRQAEPPVVKPITAVHTHHHTPVLRLEYERPGEKGRFSQVTVAPGQPLWTLDKGWIWAGEASSGWLGPSKLMLVSGSTVDCDGKTHPRATHRAKPDRAQFNALEVEGSLLDGYLNKLLECGWADGGDARGGQRFSQYGWVQDFRTTTYSIEVEGHHTFFAGPHGLLMGDSARAAEMAGAQAQRPSRS